MSGIRFKGWAGKTAIKLAIPVMIMLIWQVLAMSINNQFILPRIESVLAVLITPNKDILGSGALIDNALVSLKRVTIGFLVATAMAIPLGVVMGRFGLVHDLFDSMVAVFRPVPPLAWVPLALAWLKIGIGSMVFIIAIGAFFPILLNTLDGVSGVKKTWLEAITMLGASEKDLMFRVILPGAAPTIWTGLRVGFGIAWMCVVAAEMLPGANTGLGYLIMYAYSWGQVQVVIAGMIAIGIIGLCIDCVFKEVEDRKFSWRRLER
ncbi:MAG TPA: ABC transporter permease [Methanotrichaceae archaeon]|nr:ABC transporter permease [Methanotrichaceae archaeon]